MSGIQKLISVGNIRWPFHDHHHETADGNRHGCRPYGKHGGKRQDVHHGEVFFYFGGGTFRRKHTAGYADCNWQKSTQQQGKRQFPENCPLKSWCRANGIRQFVEPGQDMSSVISCYQRPVIWALPATTTSRCPNAPFHASRHGAWAYHRSDERFHECSSTGPCAA